MPETNETFERKISNLPDIMDVESVSCPVCGHENLEHLAFGAEEHYEADGRFERWEMFACDRCETEVTVIDVYGRLGERKVVFDPPAEGRGL